MTEKSKSAPEKKKISLIKDYRTLRVQMRLNQTEFWNRVGVTQSGGSRYEDGRKVPKTVAVLAHEVYIKGSNIDARDYK